MNDQMGAWSMLEQSMQPAMPSLEDLDPEVVANRANQEAFAQSPPSEGDIDKQMATLLQQKALEKANHSAEFQARAHMMNRSQGK